MTAERKYTPEEARQRKNTRQKEYEQRTKHAAAQKYRKNNMIRVILDLNQNTDKDIIDLLDDLPNKSGFLKQLIRDYMEEKNI